MVTSFFYYNICDCKIIFLILHLLFNSYVMNLVKRLSITIVALVAIVAGSNAQTISADTIAIIRQIESSGNIHVSYPDGLYKILSGENFTEIVKEDDDEPKNSSTSKSSTRVGYRIQVFDDNNVRTAQHEAQNRKRHIESRFPEYRVYTQFNSPYWRVKVGDFRTRSEAEAAMAAIRSAFPGYGAQLRVVRDRIN